MTTLGGAAAPTTVVTTGPENPQTPSTTTVEKMTTREFAPSSPAQPAAVAAGAPVSAAPRAGADGAKAPAPAILRETVTEKSATTIGASQKDTTRELGARLANMRGVMWVGVLLLIGGPIVGWQMGWITNGLIAAGVGLLLIILAQVVPGNEAWFGLGGLLLIPLVAYAWYHGHHNALSSVQQQNPKAS